MLALLGLLAADLRFTKDSAGSWQLLRDNKPVLDLHLTDCVTYVVPDDWRGSAAVARKAGASDIRKQLYLAFLKKQHGYQIAALNQSYGLDASAFTELEAMDFTKLDENRPEVLADDIEFAVEVYKGRLEWVFRNMQGKPKLIELPVNLPPQLAIKLSHLVDAVLLHAPVSGMVKPVVLLNCPAVKPAFATACAHI